VCPREGLTGCDPNDGPVTHTIIGKKFIAKTLPRRDCFAIRSSRFSTVTADGVDGWMSLSGSNTPLRLRACSKSRGIRHLAQATTGGTRASVVACSLTHVGIDALDDCGEQVLTACT
jgi:hypothetical protein